MTKRKTADELADSMPIITRLLAAAERDRDAMREALMVVANAVGVDLPPVEGESVRDGWARWGAATIARIAEMATPAPPPTERRPVDLTRRPSDQWTEVGAPCHGRPNRRGPEQWTIGFGYGFGAAVRRESDGWSWWISNGEGEVVQRGQRPTHDEAMVEAEEEAAIQLTEAAEARRRLGRV